MTLHFSSSNSIDTFEHYEKKLKALADQKRLQLLYMLREQGSTCVCDLVPEMQMAQSKLSYHLKILLDAQLITKETKGTWSYYSLNEYRNQSSIIKRTMLPVPAAFVRGRIHPLVLYATKTLYRTIFQLKSKVIYSLINQPLDLNKINIPSPTDSITPKIT